MPSYIIREITAYEVEAETPAAALATFLDSDDICRLYRGSYDRWIAPAESVVYGDGGPYALGESWTDEDLEDDTP